MREAEEATKRTIYVNIKRMTKTKKTANQALE